MRRGVLIPLLCSALLLAGTGCIRAEETGQPEESRYLLYFRETDLEGSAGGDVFQTEEIGLEEDLDTVEKVETLLTGLLEGPQNELLRGIIPSGTVLLSVKVEGSRAAVDFSAAYSTLSGVRLTMADYAVTLTLTQLPEIASVKITVQGQELAYRDKQTFTARDVLLSSEEDVVGTVEAALYFPDESGVLMEEWRTLELYEGDTQVSAVARALEKPPEGKGVVRSLPEGFRVKSIWLEEDTCYVNLPSVLLGSIGGDVPLDTALRALAGSLCSLDTVSEVRFLVDGEFAERYGAVDVSKPYTALGQDAGIGEAE